MKMHYIQLLQFRSVTGLLMRVSYHQLRTNLTESKNEYENMQDIQHTQLTLSHKRTLSKEREKGGRVLRGSTVKKHKTHA